MSDEKTSLFEVLVTVLLGLAALGGGWAGYQASQWGSTATEYYGKAATIATRASTMYNHGVAIESRDSELDLKGKELMIAAVTAHDDVIKTRDLEVAKFLYTQHMSNDGYLALGYPAEFHSHNKEKADSMTDEVLLAGMDSDLDEKYLDKQLAPAMAKFAESDKTFADGQKVSGDSTQFGLDGVFFTLALFLAGIALVVKNKLRLGFLVAGYGVALFAVIKLFSLPWYQA
ncbi:MAG: hypothetical protein K8W52_09090 [Deltaproteobacteria bacterium]|nr:hypothetical protein [Deltaproteobacteria bacterium]